MSPCKNCMQLTLARTTKASIFRCSCVDEVGMYKQNRDFRIQRTGCETELRSRRSSGKNLCKQRGGSLFSSAYASSSSSQSPIVKPPNINAEGAQRATRSHVALLSLELRVFRGTKPAAKRACSPASNVPLGPNGAVPHRVRGFSGGRPSRAAWWPPGPPPAGAAAHAPQYTLSRRGQRSGQPYAGAHPSSLT